MLLWLRQLFCHISLCLLCHVDPFPILPILSRTTSPPCAYMPHSQIIHPKNWSRHLFMSLSQTCHKMYVSSHHHQHHHIAESFRAGRSKISQSFIDVFKYTTRTKKHYLHLFTYINTIIFSAMAH